MYIDKIKLGRKTHQLRHPDEDSPPKLVRLKNVNLFVGTPNYDPVDFVMSLGLTANTSIFEVEWIDEGRKHDPSHTITHWPTGDLSDSTHLAYSEAGSLTRQALEGVYLREGQDYLPAWGLRYADLVRTLLVNLGATAETPWPRPSLSTRSGVIRIADLTGNMHPRRHVQALKTLARTFPRVQFLVTSNSPLLVSALAGANVWLVRRTKDGKIRMRHPRVPTTGLDADQILRTEVFGLSTTRGGRANHALRRLIRQAQDGDTDAAAKVLGVLARGTSGAGVLVVIRRALGP